MNRYVPQSVMTPEGEILDIHIVLNEMFKSGDKLFVEYSDGPIAYKARLDLHCSLRASMRSRFHIKTMAVHASCMSLFGKLYCSCKLHVRVAMTCAANSGCSRKTHHQAAHSSHLRDKST